MRWVVVQFAAMRAVGALFAAILVWSWMLDCVVHKNRFLLWLSAINKVLGFKLEGVGIFGLALLLVGQLKSNICGLFIF